MAKKNTKSMKKEEKTTQNTQIHPNDEQILDESKKDDGFKESNEKSCRTRQNWE